MSRSKVVCEISVVLVIESREEVDKHRMSAILFFRLCVCLSLVAFL